MAAIHFIERVQNMSSIDKPNNIWESGDWVVAQPTAQELIGGNIYFHSTQDGPSYFGGEITGFRVIPDDAENAAGRIVFIFKPTIAHKNIRAGRDGWGMEKKIVR